MFSAWFWAVKCITVRQNTQDDYIKLPIKALREESYKKLLYPLS